MNIQELAQKLRDKLKKYDGFKGLYLYGSQVKGTSGKDSDIDIVALFDYEQSYEKELEISGEVIDIELDNDVFIDFHSMTEKELNLNYVYFNEIKKGMFYAA